MKEVKLEIGGKTYTKTRPQLRDLRQMAVYQSSMQYTDKDGKTHRKSIAADADAQNAMLRYVTDFLGAPENGITDDMDLGNVLEALRTIDANIAECITGEDRTKNGEGR